MPKIECLMHVGHNEKYFFLTILKNDQLFCICLLAVAVYPSCEQGKVTLANSPYMYIPHLIVSTSISLTYFVCIVIRNTQLKVMLC